MAESKNTFLDRTGLSHLLSKLSEAFAKKTHAHNVATQTTSGMQSAEDKKKLDGIEDGATNTPPQFVMTLTYGSEGESHTIDKTFDELQAAYQAGSQIRLVDTSGMEYELLAFGANYMAYFAHQLNSYRYLVGFKADGTIIYTSDLPFSERNPPTAAQVGATKSNNTIISSGSIKDWALNQAISCSVGANNKVTDLPETGAYWFVDFIVTSNGLWRKLVATKTNSDGTAPTTYECTCMSSTWSEWTKVYNASNKPAPSDIGMATETWTFTLEDGSTVTKAVYVG